MAETLVDARHAYKDHREVTAVVPVADEFERGRGESLGFVDDEQLDQVKDVSLLSRHGSECLPYSSALMPTGIRVDDADASL